MKHKITLLLLVLLQINLISAQKFKEKQLPAPANLSASFIGPLINPTIHYGAKPPNFNGKVILFNHGYLDMNQVFFFLKNTFYADAYNAGYQVVFVATTRGKGMWENGKLLATSIDIVTAKFSTKKLYIIAHSNGGKAAEVALMHYKKKDKVKRVFTLGTPFWGTSIADISQMWWFKWIWKLTGLNEGAATSTTYYCANVVRPYFDNHPLNKKNKFVTLGASGFYRGHTIAAPVMLFSGAILYHFEGVNDGITSYRSSIRPGSTVVFSKNDKRAIVDHIDMALGQYMWRHIAPYLKNDSDKTKHKQSELGQEKKAYEVVSDYQIISSENEYDIVNLKNTSANIEIIHEKESPLFNIEGVQKIHSKSMKKVSKHVSYLEVDSNAKNAISINSDSKFVGFVRQKDGILMKYTTNTEKENPTLQVAFKNVNDLKDVNVNAIITKTSEINGIINADETPKHYSFKLHKNVFELNTTNFDSGIYSVYLTGSSKDFTRTLVGGFSIGNLTSIDNTLIQENSKLNTSFVKLNGTLIDAEINFEFTNISKNIATIKVFNLNGSEIISLTKKADKHITITKGVASLKKGIYLINIDVNGKTDTFKFIKL